MTLIGEQPKGRCVWGLEPRSRSVGTCFVEKSVRRFVPLICWDFLADGGGGGCSILKVVMGRATRAFGDCNLWQQLSAKSVAEGYHPSQPHRSDQLEASAVDLPQDMCFRFLAHLVAQAYCAHLSRDGAWAQIWVLAVCD